MGELIEGAEAVPVSNGPEFKRPADLPFTCSDDNLLEAVRSYLAGERPVVVCKLLGIKVVHLQHWVSARGWKFLEGCVREEVNMVAHSTVTRLMHRCFGLIDERLEKGDPIYDMEGAVIGYRAVKVKDLGAIAATLYEKMRDIEDRTSGVKHEENLTLRELADSLRNYVQAKNLERTAIPGVVTQDTLQ